MKRLGMTRPHTKSGRPVRDVEAVLRFTVAATDEVVTVAGEADSLAALVALLKGASAGGAGVPTGAVKEGSVYELFPPEERLSYIVNSDGKRIPGTEALGLEFCFPEPCSVDEDGEPVEEG